MTIQKAIEGAIEGGYVEHGGINLYLKDPTFRMQTLINLNLEEFLLDPKFWQALGKTMGWIDGFTEGGVDCRGWKSAMHRMVDALAEDKTIEEYFATL